MYGYKNSEEVAPGKQGGNFGLNKGLITKFEFNANAGTGGAEGEAIDLTVQVGDREYRKRFFPINKVYKDNVELTDKNSPEYKEAFEKEQDLFNATISDIVKCFISEETLKEALQVPIASFKDYANLVARLVQSTPNWQTKPVDVFLQYQWKITGDNKRTFLELPSNVKHGTFLIASKGDGFKEVRTDSSLKYLRDEEVHPFTRTKWFVENAFANQTVLEDTTSGDSSIPATGGANW